MIDPAHYPDSYTLAHDFLAHITKKPIPYPERHTLGLNPPQTPAGYTLTKNLSAVSQLHLARANIPLAYYSSNKIILAEAPDTPNLLNPTLLSILSLHLHIASLIIATTIIPPPLLPNYTITPHIIGLDKQPKQSFHLALAALQFAAENHPLLDQLPF